jgi:hypothetical protein
LHSLDDDDDDDKTFYSSFPLQQEIDDAKDPDDDVPHIIDEDDIITEPQQISYILMQTTILRIQLSHRQLMVINSGLGQIFT